MKKIFAILLFVLTVFTACTPEAVIEETPDLLDQPDLEELEGSPEPTAPSEPAYLNSDLPAEERADDA